MPRPDDALFRTWVEAFALLRKLLPIALLAGALAGPLFVTAPTTAMWLSALLVLLVLVGLHLANRLPLYPAHTFGIEYRYEEEPFDAEGRQCVHCGTPAESGTHRRYAKQFVALGVPLHTLEWGHNDFCVDCGPLVDGVDTRDDPTLEPEPTPGRTTTAASDRTAESEGEPDSERRSTPRSDASAGGTATLTDPDTPQLEAARRVEPTDETTAIELKRAFE